MTSFLLGDLGPNVHPFDPHGDAIETWDLMGAIEKGV